MSKAFHVIQKPGAKFYKPNCDEARRILKTMLYKKTFSQAAIDMLAEAGFEVIHDMHIENTKDSPSTIDLPHVLVRYDKNTKLWEGYWRHGELQMGQKILKSTKKQVLEALLVTAGDYI